MKIVNYIQGLFKKRSKTDPNEIDRVQLQLQQRNGGWEDVPHKLGEGTYREIVFYRSGRIEVRSHEPDQV